MTIIQKSTVRQKKFYLSNDICFELKKVASKSRFSESSIVEAILHKALAVEDESLNRLNSLLKNTPVVN